MKHLAKSLLLSAALSAAILLPAHAEMDVAGLSAAIAASVEASYPQLDALYKDLHAHPELAFEEVKTAARLAAEMRALGFEVTEKVGQLSNGAMLIGAGAVLILPGLVVLLFAVVRWLAIAGIPEEWGLLLVAAVVSAVLVAVAV